ncbi:unnamed protein product, partial [Tilletia caries]
ASPPRILLCQWHVLRAWEENIKDKIKLRRLDDIGCAQSRELQTTCRALLRNLVYARSPETFQQLLAEFQREWGMFFPDFLAYFRREWQVKRPPSSWSMAFRKHAHFGIDTNNYVESWHGTLKMNYLGLIRKQRVDRVILVLAREVVPDYARRLTQCMKGIAQRSFCAQEKEARKVAYGLQWTQVAEMVEGDVEGSLSIVASSGSHSYKVDFNLTKCTCPHYAATHLACKHMFIASRFLGQPLSGIPPVPATQLPQHPTSPCPVVAPSSTTTASAAVSALPTTDVGSVVAEAVLAEDKCIQEKKDLLEQALKEIRRTEAALQTLLRIDSAKVHARTSRSQLQQMVAELTGARRSVESM